MRSSLLALTLIPHTAAADTPTLELRSRSIPLDAAVGLDGAHPWQGRAHLLAELEQPFGSRLVQARAVSALGSDGFMVSLGAPALADARRARLPTGVSWLGAVEPRDRVHRDLWERLDVPGELMEIELLAFRDVPPAAFTTALAERAPGARCGPAGLCRATVDSASLGQLAAWDPVAWIQPWGGPAVPSLSGVTSALGVDEVRPPSGDPPSYDLSGAGVVAALIDPDCVDATHPDLAGRVLRASEGTDCSHATQCGGVLGGSGVGTQQVYTDWDPYRWTGVAPELEIAFYKTSSSPVITLSDQIVEAVEVYGAQLGSFSFRQGTGGDYDSDAVALDRLLHNGDGELSRAVPFFWATANEGSAEGYHSLADYASAKNLVAVGATNANDDSLADFSSMGPTADGRLKPDVMAPGCYDTMNVDVEIDSVRVLGGGEAAFTWDFDAEGDSEGWAPMHDLEAFEVSDGLLHTTVTGRDPYMHGPELSAESADLDTVELVFHAGSVTAGQIFWQNSEGGWAEERHLDFFMPGTGEPRAVDLDVSDHAYWTGTFTGLRVDPAVLGVTVPEQGPTYVANCGTSLAAPAAAGVAALMIQAYQEGNPGLDLPPPAVFKAMLTATATDIIGEGEGTNPDLDGPTPAWAGPDYGTGWGLVWAPGAVAGFEEHRPEDPRYRVGEVTAERTSWVMNLDVPEGGGDLRVMLAWDDPPGEAMATQALQHDLDLLLIDPDGVEHQPWVLDPDDPSAPATTGTNTLDNIEGVSVNAPEPGAWSLQVSAARLVDDAQDFAIVITADGWPIALPPAPAVDTGWDSDTPGGTDDDDPRRCGCASGASGAPGWMLLTLIPGLPLFLRRRRVIPRRLRPAPGQ
jgi:hypothetical protein